MISVLVGVLRTAQQQSKRSLRLQEVALYEQQAALRELQQTEAALRDSEARFQGLVSNLPGMVYRYAPCADGADVFTDVFTYVSSGSQGLTELAPETILQDASSFLALIHPDDLPSFQDSVAIAVENSAVWQWEGRIITPSGQLKWVQSRSRPQQTEDGEVWDGLLVDVTDRKQVEMALSQSEARFRRIFECNMVPMGIWSRSGDILHANDALLDLIGYTRQELEAGQINWLTLTPPEWLPLDEASLAEIAAKGFSTPFEKEYLHKQGHRVPILIGGASFLDDPDSGVFLAVDLIDRKQAEAEREQLLQQEQTLRQQAEAAECRLYALLASIREDFVWFDRDWHVVYLNPQAAATMQKSRDEILGKCFWDLFPDLVGTEFYDRLHQAVREQTPIQFEYCYNTWDIWFENRVYPTAEGLTVLCANITDRKQAEAAREQLLAREQAAREAAEAANRIKDEFLAVVSHELRSPLNPILGWAKLLRSHQLDEQTAERALEVIERNAQMQAQLINDLLDVSRILRGKLSLETQPVDLVATIQAAVETVRLAAEAKQIQIHAQLDPDAGRVAGDAGRLQQVIWNLLTNAVKFTSEGGRVDIRLEKVMDNRSLVIGQEPNPQSITHYPSPITEHAQITITDTGKGIPPNFLPYVFDHFRQESSATTRRFGGLGLGLAIVRYLVELHGGTVRADSPGEGQGATFTVKLPLMPHQPITHPNTKPSESSLNLQGTRILVVDDDDNTREFLTFLLELHGANVVATATAAEALTTLTQFKPEVLLSDIGMPDVDGYMLMRQIRSLSPEQGGTIPAIALTAYAGEIDYQQTMAAGFQRHIAKPIEPEVLIGAIANLSRSQMMLDPP